MSCHVCGEEAVGRCYNCGALYCERHGDGNCARCDTSIMAGDPRPDRITAAPRSSQKGLGWWRPQQAEGYTPPACYVCQGIAPQVCRHCQSRYCAEHAGAHGLCAECSKSSSLGLIVLIAAG